MDEDETRAIHDVQERLRARLPDLDARRVDDAVTTAHASLTGPIRDFVPVLVERTALDNLTNSRGRPPRAREGTKP
jgi:hypothetical protein